MVKWSIPNVDKDLTQFIHKHIMIQLFKNKLLTLETFSFKCMGTHFCLA